MTRQYIGARYVPIIDGEWDNTKTYEPLTIVTYQGNSFTSRTYVPVGIEITDTTFWAMTGNYNAQVEYYRQETAQVADDVDTIFDYFSENRISITNPNSRFYYVNSVAGSDEYDGTSLAEAFKTLDHALYVASKYYSDVRIYLVNSDTFTISAYNFSAINLHLIALSPSTTIRFLHNASFYGTHINLRGVDVNNKMTIEVEEEDKLFYLDGGSLSANYIDFNCMLRLNGAYCGAARSIFHNVFVHGGNMIFDTDCVFQDKVLETFAIRGENGVITMKGGITFDLSEDNAGDFMQLRGCSLFILSTPAHTNSYKYLGSLNINQSVYIMNNTTKTLFAELVSSVVYGPIVVTNLLTRSVINDTTTEITTDNYTTLCTLTLPSGYNEVDVAITVSNAAADVNGVIRVQSSGKDIPDTYQTINGITGRNVVQHVRLTSNATIDTTITIAVQYMNTHTVRCTVNKYAR